MRMPDEENMVFKTAVDFINNTDHPVFLTGKAGTGKTTFLRYIKEACSKNIAVVAPTGVAAINAGGTTIHSFFQLPFTPYVPVNNKRFEKIDTVDKHSLLGKLRLTGERKELMQQLDLLVIDEISMVRCDVLDAIDAVLRHVRKRPSIPFGGVQVLYIGDMYQLPPVVKDEEWKLMAECYENQYFFSSQVMLQQEPVYIELKKVYRQTEVLFIDLLNKVRNNEMAMEDYDLLHSRYEPGFKPKKEDGFITLTTHNNKADVINNDALADLHEPVFSYKANIEGEFYEKSFPADEILNLKAGAQVMFLKNDTEKVRRYYNGKIGIVQTIQNDKIWVECKTGSSTELIEVKKETWRNIKYSLNKKTQQIEEEEAGSFTQYPLRLAWAITIHKSQGLTFEKAIIDAGSAFAPGQVYVALSRCTSLAGIVLKTKISPQSLHSDERIISFSKKQQHSEAQEKMLFTATKNYRENVLQGLFDFQTISEDFSEIVAYCKNSKAYDEATKKWLNALQVQVNTYLQHGIKFIDFMKASFAAGAFPEDNVLLQERICKAAIWYHDELGKTKEFLSGSPVVSDNWQWAKDYNKKLQQLYDHICLYIHLMNACRKGFSAEQYQQQKAAFKTSPFTINSYSGSSSYVSKDIANAELYMQLKYKRDEISKEKNCPLYMVCGTESLEQMANYLPQTLHELGNISGFGKIKLKQFGNDFIDIIQDFCELNNLEGEMIPLPIKKARKPKVKTDKPDTKKQTIDLFKQGNTVEKIASLRNLAASTIEGHLAYYIEIGELGIDQLMDADKQTIIHDVISKTGIESMQKIKEELPTMSYGEVKWAVAFEKYKLSSTPA